jgi:hypothetical protein
MKWIIIFVFITNQLFCQEILMPVVSNTQLNWVYKGIVNTVIFSVPGIKTKKVGVRVEGCKTTYTITDNQIKLVPESTGEILIYFFKIKRHDSLLINRVPYLVKNLPTPKIKISNKQSNSTLSNWEIKNIKGINLQNEPSFLNASVNSFNIIIITNEETKTFSCNGNRLSEEALTILKSYNTIKKIIFEKVFVQLSDRSIVELEPATYFVESK